MLDGFGNEAQEKLVNSSVLVVGAGGLGCPVLQYLASAGLGKIGVVDDDKVELSNLQRQTLYQIDDVGELKVKVVERKLSLHNPNISIQAIALRIDSENIENLFSEFDVIIDGSDNFSTRYLVNDMCVLLGKPLIFGAIFQFSGQLSVFNFNGGPTYRCLFPEPPGSNGLPACADAGVLGVLPGIIGSMQALEAIKVICGIGNVLSGKVLLYDALNQETKTVRLSLNKENLKLDQFSHTFEAPTPCTLNSTADNHIVEISSEELLTLMQNKEVLLLDVRETWERNLSKVTPSIHHPLSEFINGLNENFPKDLSQEIAVYCKAGVRSMQACEILQSHGYKKLFNLSGGMNEWQASDLPQDFD